MSIEGSYSNFSAAGSRLTRWTARPMFWQCVMIVEQYVDYGS